MPSHLNSLNDSVISSQTQRSVLSMWSLSQNISVKLSKPLWPHTKFRSEKNSDASNQQSCERQTDHKHSYFTFLKCKRNNKRIKECYHIEKQCVWVRKVKSMLQTIEALAVHILILKKMQFFIHLTNLKAYSCSIEDCDKSFTRSNHLHRHITKSTNPEHKKKHSVLLKQKYCFLCKKPFSRSSDLVWHKKNSHKNFNRFEKDLEDQQLIVKNNKALKKLKENTLHSPHLIGQFIEVQLTAPGLTSSYHTVRQSDDVLVNDSGFLNVKDSQIHPSSSFSDSSHVPPSVSYCTDRQADNASINKSGFFDMKDFHEHSQILSSSSYYTGRQANNTSIRKSGFFNMKDFCEYSQILPSGYCTDKQVSNAFTEKNGFFDLQDLCIH